MNWSKECLKLAELCWSGNEIRSTSVFVGQTYISDGIKYKITDSTYDELIEYQKVAEKKFSVFKNRSVINLIGASS